MLARGWSFKHARFAIEKSRGLRLEALKAAQLLVSRSCTRVGRKDVVGEVKGIDVLGVRVVGRGTRNRGDRIEKVEVNPKCRSLGHDLYLLH